MSEQETTTQTNKGCFFLKKLWKGEYPLFVSFWGFGFLVLFCLGFLFYDFLMTRYKISLSAILSLFIKILHTVLN